MSRHSIGKKIVWRVVGLPFIAMIAVGPAFFRVCPQETTSETPRARKLPPRHFDEKPPLRFELATSESFPGRALVTNTYQESLTAFALEVEPEQGSNRKPQVLVFDALLPVGMSSSIPRGLTFIVGVPHIVGESVPSARIAAAVWEDRSTFGQTNILESISSNRREALSAHDLVISVLTNGLEKNWSVEEYSATLEKQKLPLPQLTELPVVSLPFQPNATLERARRTLQTSHGAKLSNLIKSILTYYQKERAQLADSLPDTT